MVKNDAVNSTNGKVKPLAELAGIIANLKAQGKRIVHCHGVFDLVHPGHIRHLETAGSPAETPGRSSGHSPEKGKPP